MRNGDRPRRRLALSGILPAGFLSPIDILNDEVVFISPFDRKRENELLHSSTVAAGLGLKAGFGIVASEMLGGTLWPLEANSGMVRGPLQFSLIIVWFNARGFNRGLSAASVITEYVSARVKPEARLPAEH